MNTHALIAELCAKHQAQRGKAALDWARETFGDEATTVGERAARFLEEALELAVACNVTAALAHRLADRAYGRGPLDVGFHRQREFGQAALTLEALGAALLMTPVRSAADEFERVRGMDPEILRESHRKKLARGEAGPEPPQHDTDYPPEPVGRSVARFDPRRPFGTREGKRAYVSCYGRGYLVLCDDPSIEAGWRHYSVDLRGRRLQSTEQAIDLVNTDTSEPASEVNRVQEIDANRPFRTINGRMVALSPTWTGEFRAMYLVQLGSMWMVDKRGKATSWPNGWAEGESIVNIDAETARGSDHHNPSPSPPPPPGFPPAPQKITRWANIYRQHDDREDERRVPRAAEPFTVGDLFSTSREAELAALNSPDLVARVCVEFCEGDGL
jgi:hypothetical protein